MVFGASGRGGGAKARLFLPVAVLVLALAVSWAATPAGTDKAKSAEGNPAGLTLGDLLAGTYREVQRYAESAMGIGVVRSAVEFLETVIRFLAEGAASGLNVIAVYVAEILRVTGFDIAVRLPLFTPEGVTAIAQWGLLALFGYWVLSVLLHLLICVLKRVFWVVKTVLALWLFGLIVTDKNATADTTAVRLWGLVLGCVLLNLLKSDSEKPCSTDTRLRNLEGRLRAVEKRKGD